MSGHARRRPWQAGLVAAMIVALLSLSGPARAEAEAEVDPARSRVEDGWRGLDVVLGLSAPLPFQVRFLDAPPRLVLDLPGLDWGGLDPAQLTSGRVRAARLGQNQLRPGWARMVLELDRPYALRSARLDPVDPALHLRLAPVGAATFAAIARPESPAAAPVPPSRPRQDGHRPLVVVVDPGHGGIDPGAEHGGTHEAALMLAMAAELRARLEAEGATVVMTREEDVFVPLETRLAIAHGAGADLFLSLHADALAEGEASGATVYTLAARASDAASAALAARHERDGLIAGVDLTGFDDETGAVLMDLARMETGPRSERLAGALVAEIGRAGGPLYKTPRREAAFSVLKSPAVPSVLIELGYLSHPADFVRIADPAWRGRMAQAIAAGVAAWRVADAAEAARLRR